MKTPGEKGDIGNNETKNVEEIRIVLQQGTKGERKDSSEGLTSSSSTTSSTEPLTLQTDASNISAAPQDITLRPAAVVGAWTEESSDSDQSELKKIRIVLDVKEGSNLTEGSHIVNTDDNKIKLDQ